MKRKTALKKILLCQSVCLLFFPFFLSAQEEQPKSVKDGWAIHLGAGYIYGGNIGLLGERQFLLKDKLRFSPFLSAGISEGEGDSLSNRNFWSGYAVGTNFEYGKMHRLIFGPHFVGYNLVGKSAIVKQRSLANASFIIGYKGTTNFGLIWQFYIGDIYLQDMFSAEKLHEHGSHIGLGIGYKF